VRRRRCVPRREMEDLDPLPVRLGYPNLARRCDVASPPVRSLKQLLYR
jgi:hypothetical protein